VKNFFLLRGCSWIERTTSRNGQLGKRVATVCKYHQVRWLSSYYCGQLTHSHYASDIASNKGTGLADARTTRHPAGKLLGQSAGTTSDSTTIGQTRHSIRDGDIQCAKNIIAISLTRRSHRVRDAKRIVRRSIDHHVDSTII